MVRKWMPQNDILAHKNVVLFISHGGLFGTSEALFHGVPLLLIPFFGDQVIIYILCFYYNFSWIFFYFSTISIEIRIE